MSNIKDTKVYSINDFLGWRDKEELEISPKYQRNSVWNHSAQSYLIDTILRGLPIPQVFIRQNIDVTARKTTREIIDGQQRLRAIIEFFEDKFKILKSHNLELGGLNYSDLSDDLKENFLGYDIPVELIKINDDSEIYSMFARLNTNNITLNKQELRNAKFWGEFKVFVYRNAEKWRDFFIDIKMFNDKILSRMLDIEFVSSLVIHILDGVVSETPTKLDDYYKKYDKSFVESNEVEIKLNNILNVMTEIFENKLFSTKLFHRKNYFFTLFCAINHQIYGLEKINTTRKEMFSMENISENTSILISKLMEFESDLGRFENEEIFDAAMIGILSKFEKNHRTRTTSISERIERIDILGKALGGE